MSRDFIYIVLYILSFYLLGFCALWLFFRKAIKNNNFLINLGLFWAIGNFLMATILFILMSFDKLAFFNQSNFLIGLCAVALMSALILLFTLKDLRKPDLRLFFISLFTFLFFLPLIKDSLFSFAIDWDAVAVVFLKAKAFFYAPGIWNNFFYNDLVRFASTNKAYPIGFSLLTAAYYRLVNHVNDQNVQLYFLIFYLNLIFMALGFVIQSLKKIPIIFSLFITLTFFIMPIFVNYSHNGYVDLPMSFVITASTVLLAFLVQEKDWQKQFDYFLLIMMVSVTAAIFKNEGYVFFGVISALSFLILFVNICKSHGLKMIGFKTVFSLLITIVLSSTAIFIWQFYLKKSATDFYLDKAALGKESLIRIKPIFFYYIDEVLNTTRYGILLIPFIFAYILESTVLAYHKKFASFIPSLALFLQLAAYSYVYMVTTVPFWIQLETSFPRLLMQLLGGFFVLVIYQASLIFP